MNKKERYIKKLGEHIRQLREKRNLTQEDFAMLIGRDRQSYQRVELGKTNPTIFYLIDIAEGLKIDFKELFSFDTSSIV